MKREDALTDSDASNEPLGALLAPLAVAAAAGAVVFWLGYEVAMTARVAEPVRHLVSLAGVALIAGGLGYLLSPRKRPRKRARDDQRTLKPSPRQRIDTRG